MPIEIRPRRPQDLAPAAVLLSEVHTTSGYPARWPHDPVRWLEHRSMISGWVAELDGAVVGHVLASHADGAECVKAWAEVSDEPCAMITRFFVSPAIRRQGLGERLLTQATEHIWAMGRRPVLDVLAHNLDAVALYERLGWQYLDTADFRLSDDTTVPMHSYAAGQR